MNSKIKVSIIGLGIWGNKIKNSIEHDVKLVKPNPKIYELAMQRFNLELEETVFIDDRLENVQAAKKLGFKIIHLVFPSPPLFD